MFYFAEGRSLVALFLFPYHHPSVDSVDSSPLWEPYLPLLEERWHAVSEWWLLFDVPFFPAGDQWSPLHSFLVGAVIGRPFLVSKTSYGTAPSTSLLLPSFPFPHSNTLRQADRLALFINLLHLCRSCYPLFFVCDRRRNLILTLFLSSLYCFQFRHFRLLHRLRKPYTFHLF